MSPLGIETRAVTLRIVDLAKRLGGRDAVDGVSLDLAGPGVVALAGPNGAGKSTLLRMAAGVLLPDRGSIFLGGAPIANASTRRRIGYVPEGADPLPELTVAELLALCASLKSTRPIARELLERLAVEPLLGQRVGTLSLGQRRRACLAAALVGAPGLLLLDEPTNGLDPGGVEVLGALLREHAEAGGLALVATHDLAFAAALGARVIRMARGRLLAPG